MGSTTDDATPNESKLGKRELHRLETSPEPSSKRRRCWADEAVRLAMRNGTETDSHRIAQRQKQIDYGKNTLAYDAFIGEFPRSLRRREHPSTPPVNQKCSKRSFDGQVRKWRRMLHEFKAKMDDKPGVAEDGGELNRSIDYSGVSNMALNRALGQADADVSAIGSDSDRVRGTTQGSGAEDCEMSDFEQEDFDDIELDDFGNVVPKSPNSEKKKSAASRDGTFPLQSSPASSTERHAAHKTSAELNVFGGGKLDNTCNARDTD